MRNALFILLFGVCLGACSHSVVTEASYHVVPLPQQIEINQEGEGFTLTHHTQLTVGDEVLKTSVGYFAQQLQQLIGMNLSVKEESTKDEKDGIHFELGLSHENKEAYTIQVDATGIRVRAVTPEGVFRAIQTLLKTLQPTFTDAVYFPSVTMTDYPRFSYRGLMLDVSRHFSNVEEVKRAIDLLALHQLNVFHWHLTDDQGWRIEIKKHPELTQIGAWRENTIVGRYVGGWDYPTDGKPHGGYYTQEQIKEIIAYAQQRYIMVVPEIDLPGHTTAVLASYPELACVPGEYKVSNRWGVLWDVICAGNDASLALFKDIMDEVCTLFPGEYVHIGGDECVKARWKACEKCQQKIKDLHLKGIGAYSAEDQLQSYFMGEVAKHIRAHGKKVIGWDEILDGPPMEEAVVMSWRGVEGGRRAAQMGHDAVMTPLSHLYFDMSQILNRDAEEIPVGGYINLEKVYTYEPVPDNWSEQEKKHIIGVQANVWCEYMPDERIRQYQILPRLAALSEIQWTDASRKSYLGFLERLPRLLQLYDAAGYRYAPHCRKVNMDSYVNTEHRCAVFKFSTLGNDSIFYTLDGTSPAKRGVYYATDSLQIDETAQLRVAVKRSGCFEEEELLCSLAVNKATFAPIRFLTKDGLSPYGSDPRLLVDGVKGTSRSDDSRWAKSIEEMEFILELKQQEKIEEISWTALNSQAENMSVPSRLCVYVSADGRSFWSVAEKKQVVTPTKEATVYTDTLHLVPFEAKFVKMKFEAPCITPSAGVSWLFLSEIGIR